MTVNFFLLALMTVKMSFSTKKNNII